MKIYDFGASKLETYNTILYGASGDGKTYIASSAAELGDVLYIAIEENGIVSIPDKFRSNIDIVKISNYKELNNLFNAYIVPHLSYQASSDTKGLIKLEESIKGGKISKPKNYKFIIVDSVTQLQKLCVNYFTKTESLADAFGDTVPQIKTWMQVGLSMEKVMKFLDSLEINVIYIYGLDRDKDEITGKIMYKPLLSSDKLLATLLSMADNILYLRTAVKEGKLIRYFSTIGCDTFKAKNRIGLPEFIKNPTMSDIYNFKK